MIHALKISARQPNRFKSRKSKERRSSGFFVPFFCLFLILANSLSAAGTNFKLGPLFFDLTGRLSFEYNDNINSSGVNAQEDIILGAGLDFGASMNISDVQKFQFNVGMDYKKYLNNSDFDSSNNFLNLNPDTQFDFGLFINKIVSVRFYDKINYDLDPSDIRQTGTNGEETLSLFQYGRYDNTFGVEADLDLNAVRFQFGMTREDLIPQDELFNFLRRTQYTYHISGFYIASENMTLGLQGSVFQTKYQENFQNNSNGFSFGGSVNLQISDHLRLAFNTDFKSSGFDNNGSNQDSSNSESINYGLDLRQTINSSFAHQISLSSITDLGVVSNTVKTNILQYSFSLKGLLRSSINGSVGYINGKESGGIDPEKYSRFNYSLGMGFALNRAAGINFNFNNTSKTSNIDGRSFGQNRFVMSYNYDF